MIIKKSVGNKCWAVFDGKELLGFIVTLKATKEQVFEPRRKAVYKKEVLEGIAKVMV